MLFTSSALLPSELAASTWLASADTIEVILRSDRDCFASSEWNESRWESGRLFPGSTTTDPDVRLFAGDDWRFVALDRERPSLSVVEVQSRLALHGDLSEHLAPGRRRVPLLVFNPPRDSVMVWDEDRNRVLTFSTELVLRRVWQLPLDVTAMRTAVTHRYDDGDLMIRWTVQERVVTGNASARLRLLVTRFRLEDSTVDTVSTVGGQLLANVQGVLLPLPLSFEPSVAMHGEQTFVYDPSSGLLVVTRSGIPGQKQVYSLRLEAAEGLEISDSLRTQLLTAQFGSRAMSRPNLVSALSELPFPETLPPFDHMRVDQIGRLWMRRVGLDGLRGRSWVVAVPEAGWGHCMVAFPEQFRFVDAVESEVFGVWRDVDDGFTIRVFDVNWLTLDTR
ncbi:MAG: hypothetical protein OXI71_07770 [Gemmatimonadota bacterium]|nr:hypothetical protein [Gemmatimonadota bacterium]